MSPSYLDHAAGLRRSARIVLMQGFGRVLPLGLYRRAYATVRRKGRERA